MAAYLCILNYSTSKQEWFGVLFFYKEDHSLKSDAITRRKSNAGGSICKIQH